MRGILSTFLVVAFLAGMICLTPACKIPKSLDDAKNMTLSNIGQTINLSKDDLSKPMKTQWGNAKFAPADVKKILALKQNGINNFEVKTDKGKTLQAVVTNMGMNRYQVVLAGL